MPSKSPKSDQARRLPVPSDQRTVGSLMSKLRPVVTPRRLWLALFVALIVDIVQGPVEIVPLAAIVTTPLDIGVAAILSVIVGLQTPVAIAFVAELIPGVGVFPCWTLAVLALCVPGSAAWVRAHIRRK